MLKLADCRRHWAVACCLLLGSLVVVQSAGAAEVVKVSETFNHKPFEYRIDSKAAKDTYDVWQLSYPSPLTTELAQNNTIPAEYYLPKDLTAKSAKRPAVICMHILGGNFELTRMMCSTLATHGIPAIMFKLPYYGERGPAEGPKVLAGRPSLFVDSLTQGMLDVRRTVDLLASRPEVDVRHIGISGISLGGIVTATAAGMEPRLTKAVPILAGGDLFQLLMTCRETTPLRAAIEQLSDEQQHALAKAVEAVDPLTHAAELKRRAQAGQVLMINAAEDEIIPRESTVKLAEALGIAEKVVWLKGLGHYSAIAALPQILKTMVAYFAVDLPPDAHPESAATPGPTPLKTLSGLLAQANTFLSVEPKPGSSQLLDLEIQTTGKDGKDLKAHLQYQRGAGSQFRLGVTLPVVGEILVGQGEFPWAVVKDKKIYQGTRDSQAFAGGPLRFVLPKHLLKVQMGLGFLAGMAASPEILEQFATINDVTAAGGPKTLRITARDGKGSGELVLAADGKTPEKLRLELKGVQATVTVRGWRTEGPAQPGMFAPPVGLPVQEVEKGDLEHIFSALVNFGLESLLGAQASAHAGESLHLVARDPQGHGLLTQTQGKTVLIVSGTPEEMGAAQGALLRDNARLMMERSVYLIGGMESLQSGRWFLDTMAEIQRRCGPFIPERFFRECDALSKAAGVSIEDGRRANLFPERFHCSGIGACGSATKDGRVLHVRVLDYTRDLNIQQGACIQVFIPEGYNAWMSLGYAGMVGSVTAMNAKGLSMGEMGHGGVGAWDGMPMSFLLREVMERCATVEEAVELIRKTPRTCDFAYVLTDKGKHIVALHATAKQLDVFQASQQVEGFPFIPKDTVLVSGGDRFQHLSERMQAAHGQIDVAQLQEIIKRPVAMSSNLHDAIFAPETLDMWCADAKRDTLACDEPYAHVNLGELLAYYQKLQSEVAHSK